ncbi:MAG: hypothetical protein AB7L94_11890 [Kofleriaceae bacterium]
MMTRLEFLRSLVGVGAGVIGLAALGACGTDTDPGRNDPDPDPGPDAGVTPDANQSTPVDAGSPAPGDGPPPTTCAPEIVIGYNHGHAMTIAPEDLHSTSTRTYQIRGTSDHPHTVDITPAQFASLRANGTLTVTSSYDDDHPHTVVITCA